jgi:response regulator RpfG family c-di-GMP phosphodiesterase
MKKILFVDDEPNVLAAFQRQLRKQFSIETALGPLAGLAALKDAQDFAVVVADMRMPEMTGVEFLTLVKRSSPDVVRMMLTGNADQATAIEAINHGNIFRFLNKPCSAEKLTEALEDGLRQHQLITAERELLENTLSGSVKVLAEILSLADPASFGNTEALRADVRALAAHLQVSRAWELEVAAMLSRIGQVSIPPDVMLKTRIGHPLSEKEQDMFMRIPGIGGNLLSQIPRLEEVSKIILYQSKRFDGSGFPDDSVAGQNIPLGARILKVLSDLAEIETAEITRAAALEQLRGRLGSYDPQILEAVGACFKLTSANGEAPAKPPLALPFAALRVGHMLVSGIETKDGTMIVAAGHRITPALLHRLRNFSALTGIKEPVYVHAV